MVFNGEEILLLIDVEQPLLQGSTSSGEKWESLEKGQEVRDKSWIDSGPLDALDRSHSPKIPLILPIIASNRRVDICEERRASHLEGEMDSLNPISNFELGECSKPQDDNLGKQSMWVWATKNIGSGGYPDPNGNVDEPRVELSSHGWRWIKVVQVGWTGLISMLIKPYIPR